MLCMSIDQTALQKVDETFEERVVQGHAPASVYAIFDRTGMIASNGFGFIHGERREPTADSLFRIASCTKSFTATALLQLRDAGRLNLDDRIDSWLDTGEWWLFGEAVEPPTLRMLLSMSGGLPSDDAWADRQEAMTSEEFDRFISNGFTLSARPGTRFQYANLGYALAGRALEHVTGSLFQDYVAQHVLEPLGLSHIGFDQSVSAREDVVTGFARSEDDQCWVPQQVSSPGSFSAIGGLFATPQNLAQWGAWLMGAFDADAGLGAVLSTRSRREMQHAPVIPGEEGVSCSYGLGLRMEDDPKFGRIVFHPGGYPGFSSQMRWSLSAGLGIVACENARYSGVGSPAAAGLEVLIASQPSAGSLPTLWPETLKARTAVERYLAGDDSLLLPMLADNVDLDRPLIARTAEAERLGARLGRVAESPHPLEQCHPLSTAPSDLSWTIRGTSGEVRCQVTLTPHRPPRVQTFTFSACST